MSLDVRTKCLHLNNNVESDSSGALSFPIYQSATFAHKGLGKSTGYDYTRLQNPTREQLEKIVASLENGYDALAFTSGMAAISAVMELFEPGDHIIIESDLYGGSIRLFENICEKNGQEFSAVDCSSENIADYIRNNTRAVFIETPTNPMMRVADIAALAKTTKENGMLLIVDNTFLSPYFQNPLDLGADIVIHSGTKYLGGHNDTIAGFAAVKSELLSEKLRFILKTVGSGLAPFDSWLILRGIKTLAVRMEKAQENAFCIAKWLSNRQDIKNVIYPGLESYEGRKVFCSQSRGFGAMITFETDTKETALNVLNNVQLIKFAESLGGVETLITYPITQTHADVLPDKLAQNGITDRILRLSVGIESEKDLIADLERAFNNK